MLCFGGVDMQYDTNHIFLFLVGRLVVLRYFFLTVAVSFELLSLVWFFVEILENIIFD